MATRDDGRRTRGRWFGAGPGPLMGPLLVALLFPSPAPAAPAQDDEQTREQATLAEEQMLVRRMLRRLRDTMTALADNVEEEGRVNAARLLRSGIEHLDARSAEMGEHTLEELMEGSRTAIREGRPNSALDTQGQVIGGLETLLSILLDRQGLEELEQQLEELREIRRALSELADQEHQLTEDTRALREDSKNQEQRDLEAAIADATRRQRELLRRNEEAARESGLFDLEKLLAALDALSAEQELATRALSAWSPQDAPELEAIRPDLERAAESGARAERLAEAADRLRDAAQEARAASSAGDLEPTVAGLSAAADTQERHGRASGDPAAAEAAEYLRASAGEMAAAENDEQRDAAADAAEQRAAELEQGARDAATAAAEARAEASSKAAALSGQPTTAGAAAQRVEEALDAAEQAHEATGGEPSEEARRAGEDALAALDQGLDGQAKLGEALEASQEAGQREARRIAEELGRATDADETPGLEAAQQSLERAAEAMQEAAANTRQRQAGEAESLAQRAQEALEDARQSLGRALEQAAEAARSEAGSELQSDQQQLARDVAEARAMAAQGSMNGEAQQQVGEALERAQEAMEQAAQQMGQPGGSSESASSQRDALDALREAAQQADAGVEPQTAEQERAAQEQAERQRRIEEQLLALARRNEERESPVQQPNLENAAKSAAEASESLDRGDLDRAEEQEQRTEQEIRDALEQLEEEEQQYQDLRQEELLFRIAEEVEMMREIHTEQMRATREVHASLDDRPRPSRSQRAHLRKIAREEETLAQRAEKIGDAIEEEGALVFTEIVRQIQGDLEDVAQAMGEAGGYRSGERIQALQDDVDVALLWLEQALRNELDRRQEEAQGEQGEQPPPGEQSLVPDVAELKLLRQIEVEVLARLQQMIDLHPELAEPDGELDPLLLEDIARLAYQHQRIATLFTNLRRKVGIPDPDGSVPEDH